MKIDLVVYVRTSVPCVTVGAPYHTMLQECLMFEGCLQGVCPARCCADAAAVSIHCLLIVFASLSTTNETHLLHHRL